MPICQIAPSEGSVRGNEKNILRNFKILVTILLSQVLYILEGQVDGFISSPVNPGYLAFSPLIIDVA